MNIDPQQIAKDLELMNSSLERSESSNEGDSVKTPKVQNNNESSDVSDDGDNNESSDGDDNNEKKVDSAIFKKTPNKTPKRTPRPKGRTMTQSEYSRRYYLKHKEEIKKREREKQRAAYVPKVEGWTKPKNEEERIARIKEAKRKYKERQNQYEKYLRAKPPEELTDDERIKLERLRERMRNSDRRRRERKK